MTLLQGVIVYCVVWWLLFFMALPFGSVPPENPMPGVNRGAPRNTHLPVKCLIVTLLAGVATGAIRLVVTSGWITVK
jgi:predicted secreted protein